MANERINLFYAIVVSLCWMYRRPVTLVDLRSFLDNTNKQIRKELLGLEKNGRITKVQIRQLETGRICAAWVISDRDNFPIELKNLCHHCETREAVVSYGDDKFCEDCFRGVKIDGVWHSLTEYHEAELSRHYATIRENQTEYTVL